MSYNYKLNTYNCKLANVSTLTLCHPITRDLENAYASAELFDHYEWLSKMSCI